jgi:hypothetical protein
MNVAQAVDIVRAKRPLCGLSRQRQGGEKKNERSCDWMHVSSVENVRFAQRK